MNAQDQPRSPLALALRFVLYVVACYAAGWLGFWIVAFVLLR